MSVKETFYVNDLVYVSGEAIPYGIISLKVH